MVLSVGNAIARQGYDRFGSMILPRWLKVGGSGITLFACLGLTPTLVRAQPPIESGAAPGVIQAVPLKAPPQSQELPQSQESIKSSQTLLGQADPSSTQPKPGDPTVRRSGSEILGRPTLKLQGVYKQEGGDGSARARLTGLYPMTQDVLFGAVVDLTTGRGFSDSPTGGLSLSELYVAASPPGFSRLRVIAGLMDYTSYFDRNSFAKDGASQFFNSVFQTNPALSSAGLGSRLGVIANLSPTDNFDVKGGVFSSRRNIGDLNFDGYVAGADLRLGTLILRGTYLSAQDAGQRSGFSEIFQFDRGGGDFGFTSGDRETAYGLNAEYFVPQLNLGFFGRYGRYTNTGLDASGDTYSFGATLLDLFSPLDRLGIAYGRQLSNDNLRQLTGRKLPDVFEIYYDRPIAPTLRGAVMVQARDQFSDIVFGFRLRTDIDLIPLGAPFRK